LSKRFSAVLVPVAIGLALCLSAAWAQGNGGGGGEGSWLWRSYRAGGWFMHPILLCWVVALIVSLERLWALLRDRTESRSVVELIDRQLSENGASAATELAGRQPGGLARVLAHGLSRARGGREAIVRGMEAAASVEIYQMERGLLWLATVANIAPLLGFLGTVSGMIHAFEDIAQAEQVSARIVAAGISEALLTTAAGLLVAIPTQAAYNFFVGRIERFGVEVEEASEDVLHAWSESRGAVE
jgi:biopolymer transport protein ExbB